MKAIASTALAVAGIVGIPAFPANADYTPMVGTKPGGEDTVLEILNTLYGGGAGGAFVGADWFSGDGLITATRVHDYDGLRGPVFPGRDNHLVDGGGHDQIWTAGEGMFRGRARFAGDSQRFGIDFGRDERAGPDGTGDVELLNVIGSGYDSDLSGNLVADWHTAAGQRWGWYREGATTNFSLVSANADPEAEVYQDHLIAYEITGLTGAGYDGAMVWLLLWDDQTNPHGDRDFNDLAIEITAIPAPAAVLLGVIGLVLAGWVRRRAG